MVPTSWTVSNFISRLSLQELFNAASAIITDPAIVSAAITISYKSAKHILASITATKLYQLIDIHIGYFSLNFLEISHPCLHKKVCRFEVPDEGQCDDFIDEAIVDKFNSIGCTSFRISADSIKGILDRQLAEPPATLGRSNAD